MKIHHMPLEYGKVKHELQGQIHELRVQIHELGD